MSRAQLEKVVLRRIHLIDAEIRKGSYPNTKQLAEMLEVGERTISRDIDEMRNFYNAPIEYDRKHHGYYYTENSFFIEDLSINQGELFGMALLSRMLEEYRNTPLEAQLKSAFHKIISSFGPQAMEDFSQMQEGVGCIPHPSEPVDPKVFSDVFQSLRSHQVLSCQYKGDKHIIFPLHVVSDKGNWYAVVQTQSKKIRLFALSKMSDSKVLRRSFTVPAGFDWHNYFDMNDTRWQSNDVKPVEGMAGKGIDYIIGDQTLINHLLDRWYYVLWNRSALRHAKFVSELGELQLRGDGFSLQFREGDHEEQKYLSREMLIPTSGIEENRNISYCCLIFDEEESEKSILIFNRFHNVGRTLLYVCTQEKNGKETKVLASMQEDVPLKRFFECLDRLDVFAEYNTFVMLLKDNVPLIAYKEQKSKENVEKEILARLQPVLDELLSSGKLDELSTGYGPDISALKRIVDKGIARASKRKGHYVQ